MQDLKGKSFMAVAPNSLGGWHMALYEFYQRDIRPADHFSSLSFGGTHDAVVKAVLKGEVDCGTVRSGTIERMAEEGKIDIQDLKILKLRRCPSANDYPLMHSTRHYPEWPIAKLDHTREDLARAVTVALLSMPADSSAARAARSSGWTVPLNYGPVKDILKEMRIGVFEDYGKITFQEFMARYWYAFLAILIFIIAMIGFTIRTGRLNRCLRQTVEELRHVQAETRRLASIVRQAIEGVAITDLDGRIEFTNQAWASMHGYENGEKLLGQRLSIFYPGEDRDRIAGEFLQKVKRMGRKIGEMEHVKASGEVFPVMSAAALIDNSQGSPRSMAVFGRDITERKEAEEHVRKTLADTERINRLMIGREKRVIEMKREVNSLLAELGRPIKYSSVAAEDTPPHQEGSEDA